MNSLVPANFGPVSSRFAAVPVSDDLSQGVQSSFGMIGYKGKVWSVRHRGDEQNLMRDDGDGPRNSIEVVIVKAATVISKVWYEDGYVEGSTSPPDCFSNNGMAPEAASAKPQSPTCAICPRNQWGSRITPAGKQGKDCSDSKRLAVVPLPDLHNEVYGGPMLLRVPAASLQDMAMYGTKMSQLGYPYQAIGTRISFDADESYPKFIFNAIRPLSDAEADIIISYADNHTVDRILSESEFAGVAAPQESPFEQPAVTPTPAKTAVSKAAVKPNGAAAANQTVGQQARAAAAATNPANKAKAQAAKPVLSTGVSDTIAKAEAATKAGGFGATAATATPKAAATAAPVKKESPAVIAAKAALAAATAAAALAAAEAEAEEAGVEEVEDADTSQGNGVEEIDPNEASDFEASIDEMLSGLLPD